MCLLLPDSELFKSGDGHGGSMCQGNPCWADLASPSMAPAAAAHQAPTIEGHGKMTGEWRGLHCRSQHYPATSASWHALRFTHCPPGPPYLLTARPHPPHLCPGYAPDREEATRDHTSLTASSESCPEAQSTFGDHIQKAEGL